MKLSSMLLGDDSNLCAAIRRALNERLDEDTGERDFAVRNAILEALASYSVGKSSSKKRLGQRAGESKRNSEKKGHKLAELSTELDANKHIERTAYVQDFYSII